LSILNWTLDQEGLAMGTVHALEDRSAETLHVMDAARALVPRLRETARSSVELAREKLPRTSGPDTMPRIERAPMRINWVNAHQTARVLHLVRDAATEDLLRIAHSGVRTAADEAHTQLDIMTLLQSAKQTLRSLVDASGSSGYRSTDHLRRTANDIAMISTHALNGEYDVAMDCHARALLGVRRSSGPTRALP
jgi:3-hydroxy-9,10-secoandrosta-1,3,5(10)-triene-9,17-dione monooxygenase